MEIDVLEFEIKDLSARALRQKRVAQALGVFLKTGRARKFIETAISMRGDTVSCYTTVTDGALYLSLDVANLEGMKDERLMGILSAFEFLNPDRTESQDLAAYKQRETTYRWTIEDEDAPELHVVVRVTARIKDDSATCQRVIVGYNPALEPTPIYKMVCTDEMVAPSDANTENAPAREGE